MKNKKTVKICCNEFAEQMLKDGWNVNGCCGGGCYVLTGLKYCPWCGCSLKEEESKHPNQSEESFRNYMAGR